MVEENKINFYSLYTKLDSICEAIKNKNDYKKGFEFLDVISRVFLPEDYLKEEIGLEGIEGLLADISNRKTIISKLLRTSIQVSTINKTALKNKKTELKLKTDQLMVGDEEIKKASSADKRQALAAEKLSELYTEVSSIEISGSEAQAFFDCVKHTYEDLSDKKETLSRQFSVIQEEINLGLITADDLIKKKINKEVGNGASKV